MGAWPGLAASGHPAPLPDPRPPHSQPHSQQPATVLEQLARNERPQLIPRELAGVSDRAGGRWQILPVVEEWKIISVRREATASVINGALMRAPREGLGADWSLTVWLCGLLAKWPWTGYLTSLGLGFLISKMGIRIAFTSQDC